MWLDQRIGPKELQEFAQKQVPVHRHSISYYRGGIPLFLFWCSATA